MCGHVCCHCSLWIYIGLAVDVTFDSRMTFDHERPITLLRDQSNTFGVMDGHLVAKTRIGRAYIPPCNLT